MKFSIKDFFSKGDQSPCGFSHITEEILNEKLHFFAEKLFLLDSEIYSVLFNQKLIK